MMFSVRSLLVAVSALAAQTSGPAARPAAAQPSSKLEFDAVSVKVTRPLAGGALPMGGAISPGTVMLTGVTPRALIARAYAMKPLQILGPSWINDQYYDIIAKTSRPRSLSEQRQMLQAMLADRFQLVVHRETRQLPVYELVVRKDGPRIRPATKDDDGTRFYANFPGISARQVSTSQFAVLLSDKLDRPVVDKTNLLGIFDFVLKWTPENADPEVEPGPSVFTAIQEQLGLKLEARRAPVEVIVVDRVSKPSPN